MLNNLSTGENNDTQIVSYFYKSAYRYLKRISDHSACAGTIQRPCRHNYYSIRRGCCKPGGSEDEITPLCLNQLERSVPLLKEKLHQMGPRRAAPAQRVCVCRLPRCEVSLRGFMGLSQALLFSTFDHHQWCERRQYWRRH